MKTRWLTLNILATSLAVSLLSTTILKSPDNAIEEVCDWKIFF